MKPRLIITTDIGGNDKDDIQSMIHFLHFQDRVDLRAIVVGLPRGKVEALKNLIKIYKKDYEKYKVQGDSPRELKKKIFEGAKRINEESEGSRKIIEEAKKGELKVICWGTSTDLAMAIRKAPAIAKNIKAYTISGDYNLKPDIGAQQTLREALGKRLIEDTKNFRNIYLPGINSKAKYGNIGFVEKVIKKHGELGKYFKEISATIDVNRGGIKMGDTPSLLWTWGWKRLYRKKFLKDWEKRMKEIYE